MFFAPDGGNPTTKWPVQVWWRGPRKTVLAAQEVASCFATFLRSAAKKLPRVALPAPQAYRQRMNEKREQHEMDKLAEHMPTRDHPTATEGSTVPKLISFIHRMKTAQETDTYCITQKAKLAPGGQEGQPPTRQFKIAAGLLWHIAEGRYRLVTPAQPAALREITLQECHDAPFAGHLGVHKTLARLRSRFWWVGMA